ncbi:alpha/beta hydrolase family protein [Duganella guangzhouensis]|uniref:alpha/beta hydrolase family protein n=1 Tax=Duganella guangzhouensis TaxID=2666084 RepID=UPI0035308483
MLAAVCALAGAAPLTIEQAANREGAGQAVLSPDGKHIAIIFSDGISDELQVYDTETGTSKVLRSAYVKQSDGWRYIQTPWNVIWASNDLLAVDYSFGAVSMDLNGKEIASLGQYVVRRAELDDPDSPWVLICADSWRGVYARVNARTGERRRLDRPGGGKAIKLAFDRHGVLRAATLLNSETWRDMSTVSNWYLPEPGAEWQKLAQFSVVDDYWMPAYVPDQPHTLAITSRMGRDAYAFFAYDTQAGRVGDMLAGSDTQDILSVGGIEQQSYERVTTGGLQVQSVWFDPVWAGVQQVVDAALPKRINRLSGNPRGKVLVYSYSDIEPGTWYLLDMKQSAMRPLLQHRVAAAKASMRPMEMMQYAAADGLSIPAFLTRPADGATKAPLVVLIHGGPTERDYWGWNEEVQLLAARGYAVFQPQFRGSSGFGKRFEQAGYGQWGLAMQDDITAGVRHLISEGIADPARICIVGASYGGYAAMWGLVKTPELYQCGVSFAGVADIEYMFQDDSDRTDDKVTREMMLSRIGDARTRSVSFDQVSPLKHAERIRAPVLLMHGEDDQRVPLSHGKKMRQALERNGKQVQWLSFEEEGHGLAREENRVLYYRTLLAFLDKYIGDLTLSH